MAKRIFIILFTFVFIFGTFTMVLAQNEKETVQIKEQPKQIDLDKNKLEDGLEKKIEGLENSQKVPVIVMLDTQANSRMKDIEQKIRLFQSRTNSRW